MDLAGKVAVITGGGSGIGRATAQRLASDGVAAVIADLDPSTGQETVNIIERAGGRAVFIRTDVTLAEQARAMLDTAITKFRRLDILFNNAGVGLSPPGFPRASLEAWRRVLDIDLQAVILGCYLAAPLMERDGGAIINTASMAGLYPYHHDPIYAAAKAGVVNFSYSLSGWAAERKIRVNCICPGIVDTPLVHRLTTERAAAGLQSLLPGKIIQPETIADAVMLLLRDDTLFGRALEIRPSGPRLVDTLGAPGSQRK
ncbi:MAG TPA: SDR family NAD(P)-dependent oxidoreductase [Candidatus Binataceae bacterium]|nr:SDR family NAD(P)-dependent oxidoreductase [Candidatus Binataceae bacterium]